MDALPALGAWLVATAWAQPQYSAPYVHFESGLVHPVALSPDRSRLFVANVAEARIELFSVGKTLHYEGAVPVGLEPVTVVPRTDQEVWVVNHISDSISIVDVSAMQVVRTLLVGDEPRDLVFASGRAFVTTAHRGQHRLHPDLQEVPGAGDPAFTTPGVGRADVWVFDAKDPGPGIGGTPLAIRTLFGDTPRALAVSPDGQTVYAAVFHSGNRTTVVPEGAVCDGFDSAAPCFVDGREVPGGNPGPATNVFGDPAPEVGLIVRYDPVTNRWVDDAARDWSGAIRFELPDYDVFAIDAQTLEDAAPPVSGVGTTLFDLTVDPEGRLYVAHTEAHNDVRFEGPGTFGGTTVRGRLASAGMTVIDRGEVTRHRLNPHLEYQVRPRGIPAPPEQAVHSLATPVDAVLSADGSTLYVAALGSRHVGVVPTEALRAGRFDPTEASGRYLATGGGPSGLALDDEAARLYVYTRFDHAVATIDLVTGETVDRYRLPSPEPAVVTQGRRLLYDAEGSSNGEASCAACHVYADVDHLSWDLGNPDAPVVTNPVPIAEGAQARATINGTGNPNDTHPMKGPMATQTLKGIQHHGALHWRGDRSVGPHGTDPFDVRTSFLNFSVAFTGLLGGRDAPDRGAMDAFWQFTASLALPPNPVRRLDRALTPTQAAAFAFFDSEHRKSDGVLPLDGLGRDCEACHSLDPEQGFFGSLGLITFERDPQAVKIPHLRNLYQRVGMFGTPTVPGIGLEGATHLGPQVRGYGFTHDGSVDTLFRFFSSEMFDARGPDVGFRSDEERRSMVDYMLAFDADVAPIVGQQITVKGTPTATQQLRIDELLHAASRPFVSKLLGGNVTECDVVAFAGPQGWLHEPGVGFHEADRSGVLSLEGLLDRPEPVTFTAVLPGTGERYLRAREAVRASPGASSPVHPPRGWGGAWVGLAALVTAGLWLLFRWVPRRRR